MRGGRGMCNINENDVKWKELKEQVEENTATLKRITDAIEKFNKDVVKANKKYEEANRYAYKMIRMGFY